MAKMSILFDGFADLAAIVDKKLGNTMLHKSVDEALNKSVRYIQGQVSSAAAPYAAKGLKGYATGDMYKTIGKNQSVTWHGSVAEVGAGFNLDAKGGWHSIFVMYGTPRMQKNQKVYNAIKGSKTKREVAKIQQEVMSKYINLNKG